jgi:GIY-YIG catalytic domain
LVKHSFYSSASHLGIKWDGYPSRLNLVPVISCSTLFRRRENGGGGEIACTNNKKNGRRFYSDNSDNRITSEVLNGVLANQGVSITQEELNILLNLKGVTFELPLNNQTYSAFFSLVGRPKTRKRKAGIYIFTHLATGRKYVGSSNSLSIRLEQYFNPNPEFSKDYGLLLPLIKAEGFSAFKLEVLVMPEELSSDNYFLFLEQYYLLDKKFNLNTQRVVNFRVNQVVTVYLYDIEGKILYYTATSLNGLKADLGVHYATSTKFIKTGSLYLNYFLITDQLKPAARKAGLSLDELSKFILDKKALFLKQDFSMKTSKLIYIKQDVTGVKSNFPSITSLVKHFESINIKANRNKIASCLNTNESYLGYTYYTGIS